MIPESKCDIAGYMFLSIDAENPTVEKVIEKHYIK